MTRSAPSARSSSSRPEPSTAVTLAPRAFATCNAIEPTPPAAPLTRTVRPSASSGSTRRFNSAMMPAVGTDAACSNVTLAGLCASCRAGADAYSA